MNLILRCPTEEHFERLMKGLEDEHGPRQNALKTNNANNEADEKLDDIAVRRD